MGDNGKINRREFLVGVAALAGATALPMGALKEAIAGKQVIQGGMLISICNPVQNTQFLDLKILLKDPKISAVNKLYFDDEEIPFDKNGDSFGEFAGLVQIKISPFKTGLYPEIFETLMAVDLRLKWHPVKFKDGIPALTFGVLI